MLKMGIALLALFSSALYAQDIVYMNDGSIVKGNITEIDDNGDLIIQLDDGEEFTLKEYNIQRIVHEKQVSQKKASKEDRIAAYKKKLRVDEASGSRSGYSSFSSNESVSTTSIKTPTSSSSGNAQSGVDHNLSIGTMIKSYKNSNENGVLYSGIGIAYQRNFSKKYALYSSLNIGKLDAIIRNGNYYDPSNNYVDEYLRYIQVAGLVTISTYKKSTLFGGLGVFTENLTGSASDGSGSYDDNYSGVSLHMGFTYSWETFSMRLRTSFDFSNDYENDAIGNSRNLQLSWNL